MWLTGIEQLANVVLTLYLLHWPTYQYTGRYHCFGVFGKSPDEIELGALAQELFAPPLATNPALWAVEVVVELVDTGAGIFGQEDVRGAGRTDEPLRLAGPVIVDGEGALGSDDFEIDTDWTV